MLDHYSFSSLSKLSACAQAFKYAYVDKIEPIRTSVNLVAGSAMHRALHALYSDAPRWHIKYAIECMKEEWGDQPVTEASHLSPLFLETVIQRYAKENEKRDEAFEPLGDWGEVRQTIKFGATTLTMVPDLIGENAFGDLELRDHKTTGGYLGYIPGREQMSYQGRLYMAILRNLGLKVEAFSVNGIYLGKAAKAGKAKNYPGKSEVFQIVDVWDESMELEVFEWAEDRIAEHTWRESVNRWPQTDSGMARAWVCRYCDFKSICERPVNERAGKIAGLYREKEVL